MIISTIVEFPACIRKSAIEAWFASKKIAFDFNQSDNLHHKYFVCTKYASDFVELGYWMANEENEMLERGK